MCDFSVGVNNNRSSFIVSRYFLLCNQSIIAFIYDYQMDDDIFIIYIYEYEVLPKYGKILQNLFEFSKSLKE